ncbi:hypothetical protein Tco_0894602 [Tanacetum coccineum]|uniref:Uncharacterized protein n=1 Tax=Tanacetum coccineum TaxID=301880 RepID=A0ABQ5CCL2_9ASTR
MSREELELTKLYIPKISREKYILVHLKPIIRDLENRSIHAGRTMHPEFAQHSKLKSKFPDIRLQCLYDVDEDIHPRFLLELFSSAKILRDEERSIRFYFWSLNKQFIIPLEYLAHILQTSLGGDCAYSNEYSLESLNRFPEEVYPYQSLIPTPDEIINDITINGITEDPLRILKNELQRDFRFWNEVIECNAIGEETNSQYVLASSCHMIYCILNRKPYNFTYFLAKRITLIKNSLECPLSYGMLLARLFKHLTLTNPELIKPKYFPLPHTMLPLDHTNHLYSYPPNSEDED